LTRTVKNVVLSSGQRINRLLITLAAGFFESCFFDPELDIRGIREEKKSYRLHRCYDQISTKTIFIKNRSTESNFCKNSFVEKKTTQTISVLPVRGFSLAYFYPLSQPEAAKLQALCGRQFSANAINEILLSMSKRLTDRCFKSKKAFLSYMGKVFCHEKRDAVKINNDSFKIRNNLHPKEIEDREREKYLANIELSKEISSEWQLK
jgi:hypothetical protein